MPRTVRLVNLGLCPYDAALRWQSETAEALRRRPEQEALALVEHPPVYTFGRRPRYEHLLLDAEELHLRGAEVVETDRGGDITFHGPGQLVAYPILDLRDRGTGPVEHVRALEETVIRTLARFGVRGTRLAGRPGVWTCGAKVAAVGVRIQGGVTTHGLALNVDTDLSWFDAIVPCGLRDAEVTSLQRILGATPGLAACQEAFCAAFEEVFASTLAAGAAPTGETRELVTAHER